MYDYLVGSKVTIRGETTSVHTVKHAGITASNVKVLDILDLYLETRALRVLSFRQYSALIWKALYQPHLARYSQVGRPRSGGRNDIYAHPCMWRGSVGLSWVLGT